MIIPTDRETKYIKDRNVDIQGYSEYEITKIKTEYTNLMSGELKVDNNMNKESKKYTRTSYKNYYTMIAVI